IVDVSSQYHVANGVATSLYHAGFVLDTDFQFITKRLDIKCHVFAAYGFLLRGARHGNDLIAGYNRIISITAQHTRHGNGTDNTDQNNRYHHLYDGETGLAAGAYIPVVRPVPLFVHKTRCLL